MVRGKRPPQAARHLDRHEFWCWPAPWSHCLQLPGTPDAVLRPFLTKHCSFSARAARGPKCTLRNVGRDDLDIFQWKAKKNGDLQIRGLTRSQLSYRAPATQQCRQRLVETAPALSPSGRRGAKKCTLGRKLRKATERKKKVPRPGIEPGTFRSSV